MVVCYVLPLHYVATLNFNWILWLIPCIRYSDCEPLGFCFDYKYEIMICVMLRLPPFCDSWWLPFVMFWTFPLILHFNLPAEVFFLYLFSVDLNLFFGFYGLSREERGWFPRRSLLFIILLLLVWDPERKEWFTWAFLKTHQSLGTS